jgi:hypothetical protein
VPYPARTPLNSNTGVVVIGAVPSRRSVIVMVW